MNLLRHHRTALAGLFLVLLVLVILHLPTLQTIINGSSHLMMIDVGETQVVLNTWGTLHATGYPVFVILGNILVTLMKAVGISAATAPALVSMVWGLLALSIIYLIALNTTPRIPLALLLIFVFGLTRFVWLHQVIAEIYSFSLLTLVVLLWVALWQRPLRYRILILAILGGIAVSHYRTIAFTAPALIFAAWPDVKAVLHRPKMLILSVLGALLGFIPYIYLPLRAKTGDAWVYGSPQTWQEVWFQFRAAEANYLFHWPESTEQFLKNWERINTLLTNEISLLGVLLGLLGLGIGLWKRNYRRTAITLILSAIPAYIFAVVFYYDILALVILNITLTLAFGWLFLADALLDNFTREKWDVRLIYAPIIILALLMSGWLYAKNNDFIHELTHDETGIDTIAMAQFAPPDSTLMLAWGPRYFAVGFAQDVEGQLQSIRRADHNADFRALLEQGPIVTPDYTFFAQPESWWEAKLGRPVYLQGVGPALIEISTERTLLGDDVLATLPRPDTNVPIVSTGQTITCTYERVMLAVDWVAIEQPERNLSVLVHLLDANEAVIAQDDKFAPVFGRRPLPTWVKGEQVHDVYTVPRMQNGLALRYGLYEQLPDDTFQNYNLITLPLVCP